MDDGAAAEVGPAGETEGRPDGADETTARIAVASLATLISDLPEELRRQALTHSSWTERRADSFERLAFLGDSVLGLSVAGALYERFPDVAAGGLTKIHNQAVSGVSCAAVGRLLGVPEMLRANEPADVTAAIPAEVLLDGERPLPEATEALIGACHIAHGFEPTAAAVGEAFTPRIELASETRIDFKSALQELLARRGARVAYEVTAATGPPHRRTFAVAAIVDSERVGTGEGRSKKAAEQVAAEQALRALGG
jgi:ribonuclease III